MPIIKQHARKLFKEPYVLGTWGDKHFVEVDLRLSIKRCVWVKCVFGMSKLLGQS